MSAALRVLLIEDSEDDATLLMRLLRQGGYVLTVERVETAETMRAALDRDAWDLVLSDYSMPQFSAPSALQLLHEVGLDLPFIIVSGTIGEETAVAAMKAGAHDFLMKSNLTRLIPAIARELREAADRRERRHAEAAQRAAEQRFAAVLDAAAEAIIAVDDSQRIVLFNASAAHTFGYTESEALGQPLDILLPARLVEGHRQQIRAFAAAPEPSRGMRDRRGEFVGLRKDGTEFPIEVSIAKLYQNGQTIFTVFLQDITERKRLEAQLLQAQKMESIGQLAGGIAHDFNNILTAIVGYTDFARDALPPDHAVHSDLEEVQKAAQRATALTRQLLAFARKQVIEPHVIQLNDLIIDIDKMLRRLIGADIDLVTLPAPDLGHVKVDPGQIEQVIVNLAVNARDAMPTGGKLTIETANVVLDRHYARTHVGVIPGEYVLLAVSDTGMGIAEAVKQHIFEPFFTTKEPGKGTGLGLATCYGIVKQHGGNIWMYSEAGHGTTFNIYLPRVADALEIVRQPDNTTPSAHGAETVLVVEDDPAVRALTARILRAHGYIVLEAGNGTEAMQLAHAPGGAGIHLLLTDIVMPQMSGTVLAEQLTALYPHIKVLFVSGYAANALVHHGRLDSRMMFLQKPIVPAALARKVREVLTA